MSSAPFLNAAQAAARLGVSAKALRLYEQRGLIAPLRTAAGWRAYGPQQMVRAGEIAALRKLGLSLAQIERVLTGDADCLKPALEKHQAALERQARQLVGTIDAVRRIRVDLDAGRLPGVEDLARLAPPAGYPRVAFDLPWPWGGERFALFDIKPLTYIIGPLGSGKTRLAQTLAKALPGGAFIGLDRLADDGASLRARLDHDPGIKGRVERTLALLAQDGATPPAALTALLLAMEAEDAAMLVIDMVEQGLDAATQAALSRHVRLRGANARPLFLMTRSRAILDLLAVTSHETILFCPANHSPPHLVAAYPGAMGYEAVASCLASPEVRARTEGTVAWRPAG